MTKALGKKPPKPPMQGYHTCYAIRRHYRQALLEAAKSNFGTVGYVGIL